MPAGTFDAFVVRVTEQGQLENRFLEERAVWLAAGSHAPLRMQRRTTRGIGTDTPDWEATSISVPR